MDCLERTRRRRSDRAIITPAHHRTLILVKVPCSMSGEITHGRFQTSARAHLPRSSGVKKYFGPYSPGSYPLIRLRDRLSLEIKVRFLLRSRRGPHVSGLRSKRGMACLGRSFIERGAAVRGTSCAYAHPNMKRQQSRRRYAASSFAFVPQVRCRCPPVPSRGIRQGYRTGTGASVHLCRLLPFRGCGNAQSDQHTIARSRVHGCSFRATLGRICSRWNNAASTYHLARIAVLESH